MKKFRPSNIPKLIKMKHKHYDFNHSCSENDDYPFLLKTFMHLHYLGSHSPLTKKWSPVEKRFLQRLKRHTENIF